MATTHHEAPVRHRLASVIRAINGVREHFDTRITEWAMALMLGSWGLNLLDPAVSFSFAPAAWKNLIAVPFMDNEFKWGWAAIFLGAARTVALILNGTFPGTVYSRYSPNVRALVAFLGALIWFQVAMSVGAVPSPGRLTYLLPLTLEIWCVFHASRDTGRARAQRDADL
jgi:hypothetical protein